MARFAELLENGADVPGSPAAVQLDHQMHKYHDVRSKTSLFRDPDPAPYPKPCNVVSIFVSAPVMLGPASDVVSAVDSSGRLPPAHWT